MDRQDSFSQNINIIKSRNTDNAIYFNFSYSALKLLGKNLYNNSAAAISELVANGLDAKAKNVYVYIDMSDKAHSVIEIMDDGMGMDYNDLAEKYVWIGRNKREDTDILAEDRKNVMGRKGIGKLAALFLSNNYYIATKKIGSKSVNQWRINLGIYRDSDFPKMDRVQEPIRFINQNIWESFEHGTTIKLNDVDLRRNGARRIEALKQVFADFYLLYALDVNIFVAVKNANNQKIAFEKVEKAIAFKNFYAMYDNTTMQMTSRMSKGIAFKWASQYPHIADEIRPTLVINPENFVVSGKQDFHTENGDVVTKEYRLTGWIGVHSTIESKHAVDPQFIRNDVYQPNRLRLYVRNKLAVANYFDMRRSTQTMADYIEGEISFDILDDDDLPDIATSSRQDFLADERVELLISIVDPIVNTLFKVRNEIGQKIRSQNTAYAQYLVDEKEKKRKAEEEARRKAEEEAKRAEEAKKEEERKRKQAEQAKANAEAEAKKYHEQSKTIFNAITEDQETFSAKTHLVKTNALSIRNYVKTLGDKIGISTHRELGAISVSADKILSALKYSALATFNIEDEYIVEDLFAFCKEYLEKVLAKQYYSINIVVDIVGEYRVRFSPQYVTLLLDNFLSNSDKSHATTIRISMIIQNESHSIIFADDGDGFVNCDMDRIFEFGFSNTGGTGIGLYNITRVVQKMRGTISAEENTPKGAKFTITF